MAILKPENIEFIVVHCSATSPNQYIGAKEINQMHLAKGWSKIGYHLVIRRDLNCLGSLIEFGRGFNLIGAHVKGYNDKSLGICMVGGVDENNKPENNFTAEQFSNLQKTLIFLTAIFPNAKVRGHRDFPGVNKACPCFSVSKFWRACKNKQNLTSIIKQKNKLSCNEPEPILAPVFEW